MEMDQSQNDRPIGYNSKMQQKLRMLLNFTLEQMVLLGIFRDMADAGLRSTLHRLISSKLVCGWSEPPTSSILSELLCLRVFSSAKDACLEAPRTEY